MKKDRRTVFISMLLSLCSLFYTLLPASAAELEPTSVGAAAANGAGSAVEVALDDNIKVGSRVLELLFGKDKSESKLLIPGGEIFGARIKQKYVSIVEASGIPALSPGDLLLSLNGQEVNSSEDVKNILKSSHGGSVTVRARHKGSDIKIEVRPRLEDGEYRLGLTLRDGAMGIGTLTFIDPETGLFGGLGHGICDSECGCIIELDSGEVTGVLLGGIHKGEAGKPGELSGILTDEIYGSLTANCECGVFGILDDPSKLKGTALTECAIAERGEVREGEARIISTLKNGKTMEYKVEISEIDRGSTGSKSFKLHVTDPALIAITGGIVRGMSGSPIIQNGKLVGAVTHVMVANPTEGYGIFIENMLNAAQGEAIPKAA